MSAGVRFHSTSDSGAFVVLNPPGVAEEIQSRLRIVNYMRDHFDSWLEFANSRWGIGLRPEDIVFVSETVKTTEWAVVAFKDDDFRDQEGSVSAQFGSFGRGGFSLRMSKQLLPTSHYRAGPHPPLAAVTDPNHLHSSEHTPTATSATVSPSDPSQCLFIHYYKMKRRLVKFWGLEPMQASAGPHQLPPDPDNTGRDSTATAGGGSSTVYEFECEPVLDDVCALIFLSMMVVNACEMSPGVRSSHPPPRLHFTGMSCQCLNSLNCFR